MFVCAHVCVCACVGVCSCWRAGVCVFVSARAIRDLSCAGPGLQGKQFRDPRYVKKTRGSRDSRE